MLVLGVAVVLATLAGCGSSDEPQVLGTSVTAPTSTTTTSTTTTSTTTTSADVDVRISATSVVRGQDEEGDATADPPANARRNPSAATPTLPAGPSSAAAAAAVRSAIESGDLCAAYRRPASRCRAWMPAVPPGPPGGGRPAGSGPATRTRGAGVGLDGVAGRHPSGGRGARPRRSLALDEAAAVYRDQRFRRAMEETDRWVAANCDG